MVHPDTVKNELQGDGFLKEVKADRLPDPEELSENALKQYESRYASLNPGTITRNADHILQELLELERDIYIEQETEVYREALRIFLEEKYDTGQASLSAFAESETHQGEFSEYPQLQELFSQMEEIYRAEDGFTQVFSKILPLLYPAMDAISVSAQQSRRKRAGSSLRYHIENLVEKAGHSILTHDTAGNGHVYEVEAVDEEYSGTIYISFLTTLRDRFRQSFSDSSLRNSTEAQFIATGAGNDIFTSSSRSDITTRKVEEITDEGFTLIVFEGVKQDQHQDVSGVVSYREFFSDRLPADIA
ncbi:hypothetical protein [Halorubrum tropicale]|uniref:hypothetical protein n=1 Tax=Halorubrum tropicale TaxID=1765655 RepID=UPI000ADB7CA8|nr:hypothetical protein [Halorubrum tropicale]